MTYGPPDHHLCVVVMGVSGSGKTTIAEIVADRCTARFVDADDLHPRSNVAKMSAGIPLADEDRWPWLDRVARELDDPPVVATCSALKRSYRDRLRAAGDLLFVLLDIDRDAAIERLSSREGHFMGPEMIDSQFADLEPPERDETDVVTVDAGAEPDRVIEDTLGAVVRHIAG